MTAAGRSDDNQLTTFLTAAENYVTRHRHTESTTTITRNAQRAGLAAVRADWERHPDDGEADLTGHVAITDPAEKDRLKAEGWTCLGYSTFYFLEPPGAVDGGP